MSFYEIKIHYVRQTGEEAPSKVHETYWVEGVSCSDVETRLLVELKPFISGDYEVVSCKQVRVYDLFTAENASFWFIAKTELITIDGDKEIHRVVNIAIQDNSITSALDNLSKQMSSVDYEVITLTKSPIMEVIRAI